MRLTRCYVPPPLQAQALLTLPRAAALHLARVLRLREGAAVTVFDGQGGEYQAEIVEIHGNTVRVRTHGHQAIEREAPLRVVLLQAVARAERMDLIVQKATELGVASIVPLSVERSLVRLDAAAAARRREHWRQVAISACEQCGRNRIPQVHELTDLERACADTDPASLHVLLSPQAEQSLAAALSRASPLRARSSDDPSAASDAASTLATAIVLLVGPEGGFSAADLAVARRFGFEPCQLGPRILRTETAPLAALATIQAVAGDFR